MNETLLAPTFAAAANTMVADSVVVDFLPRLAARSMDLFDAGEASIGDAHPISPPGRHDRVATSAPRGLY